MTYSPRIFTTRPDYYEDNVARASKLRAAPGLLSQLNGVTEPAVVIFSGNGFQYALNEQQAYKLADSIADALESHRQR